MILNLSGIAWVLLKNLIWKIVLNDIFHKGKLNGLSLRFLKRTKIGGKVVNIRNKVSFSHKENKILLFVEK